MADKKPTNREKLNEIATSIEWGIKELFPSDKYEAIGNMGFTGGNILEPACGVGNFFGLLPESMAASKLYGTELDSLTGRIASSSIPRPTSPWLVLRLPTAKA